MSSIYAWVKGLVFFYILMTAVLYLLPKSNYQKYVRFFGGLLLVVLIVSPILEFFSHPDELLDRISYESFWQEMDSIKLDIEGMGETQKQVYKETYEKAIANDISLMAQEEELEVLEAEVKLAEDYRPWQVTLSVVPWGQEEGIFIEKIIFSDNSSEYPGVRELKQKIMDFYKISEDDIQIAVREG